MRMTRRTAETIAHTLRHADIEGRWTPCAHAEELLIAIETAVSMRIQARQPQLELMQDRLARTPAILLLAIATADMANGRIERPKATEIHLFGEIETRVPQAHRVTVPGTVTNVDTTGIQQLALAA